MAKKETSIGTRILVSIVVIVAASITLINLLTIFGVIDSPDLLTYGVLIGVYLLPILVIAGTLNKIIFEEKSAIEKRAKGPKEIGKQVELKINFKEGETIFADTTSHPAFYVKIAIASALSVSLGATTLIILPDVLVEGNITNFLPILLPVFILCIVIHFFSKNIFGPHGWGEFMEHTWVALLVIAISISTLISLKGYILTTYPRQFWETFLGMPFSLPALMFLVMLLLVGGILIRLGDLLELEGGPFKASGTTFVLVSIAFMVPQFQLIPMELLLELVSQAFSISLIIYGMFTGLLLYRDAGMRFLVTSERVIKLNTNNLKNSTYYPLKNMNEVKVVQDIIAATFGYGNLVMYFKMKKRYHKKKVYCVFYGVSDPKAVAKTIKAVRSSKRKKKKIVRKKIIKKKPVSKDNFYYRSLLPILLFSLIFSSILTGVAASEPSEHVRNDYLIVYEGSSSFMIEGDHQIFSLVIEGEAMDDDDIRTIHQIEPIDDVLEDAISDLLETLIFDSYHISEEDADVHIEVSLVEGTMEADGPILIDSQTNVELKNSHFDLSEDVDVEEIAHGLLKAGAQYSTEMNIQCRAGHEDTYVFEAPEGLVFQESEFHIDNREGSDTVHEDISLTLKHTEPDEIDDVDSEASLVMDIYRLKRGEKGEFITLNLNLSASFGYMDIPSGMELPEGFHLDHVSPAVMRLMYENGLDGPVNDFIDRMEDRVYHLINEIGDVKFDGGMEVINLDTGYDRDTMDPHPPIEVYYNATIERHLAQDLNSLASIPTRYSVSERFSLNVENPTDIPLDFSVSIPEGLTLQRAFLGEQRLNVQRTDRYFVQGTLEPYERSELKLDIGTEINLMDFLPFAILIGLLFFIWISLNFYNPKR